MEDILKMNLVSFSIKTKGIHNFARRLWTVFTRFGFSEAQTRQALHSIIASLQKYNTAPTFFIPAVVLGRHPALLAEIANCGAEIGIHGYVHDDYRSLSKYTQYKETEQAVSLFQKTQIPYLGFRNPYLGWTEDSLDVFTKLGFLYESNEAVIHHVVDLIGLSSRLRRGYEKSLALCQAIPCSTYSLRPHFEGTLLRIPTSIPDDEMLFDRLRITNPQEVGRIWSEVMQRVYDFGGLYALNLHPERGLLGKEALEILLSYAAYRPLPIWLARLQDVAQWWKERSQFRLNISPVAPGYWWVEACCTPRATLLARHLEMEDQPPSPWMGSDVVVQSRSFTVKATHCPCIGLSLQTPQEVADFLHEQGYPNVYCPRQDADIYALYLDMPEGFREGREQQFKQRSTLIEQIDGLKVPLLQFGCWPDGSRAALAISGDIDSVTVQDFFLRIIEVYQSK